MKFRCMLVFGCLLSSCSYGMQEKERAFIQTVRNLNKVQSDEITEPYEKLQEAMKADKTFPSSRFGKVSAFSLRGMSWLSVGKKSLLQIVEDVNGVDEDPTINWATIGASPTIPEWKKWRGEFAALTSNLYELWSVAYYSGIVDPNNGNVPDVDFQYVPEFAYFPESVTSADDAHAILRTVKRLRIFAVMAILRHFRAQEVALSNSDREILYNVGGRMMELMKELRGLDGEADAMRDADRLKVIFSRSQQAKPIRHVALQPVSSQGLQQPTDQLNQQLTELQQQNALLSQENDRLRQENVDLRRQLNEVINQMSRMLNQRQTMASSVQQTMSPNSTQRQPAKKKQHKHY